jgi:hypothetical protein
VFVNRGEGFSARRSNTAEEIKLHELAPVAMRWGPAVRSS